jgi:hypothetical protein
VTLYSQELALTSPASGGRSVGIVRSRTKATQFVVARYDIVNSKRSSSTFRNKLSTSKQGCKLNQTINQFCHPILVDCLLSLLFCPEDGSSIFLQNVSAAPDCSEWYAKYCKSLHSTTEAGFEVLRGSYE